MLHQKRQPLLSHFEAAEIAPRALCSAKLCRLQNGVGQASLAAYHPKNLQALGAVLGSATSSHTELSDTSLPSKSDDAQLRRSSDLLKGPAESGASQEGQAQAPTIAPALSTGLSSLALANRIKSLQSSAGLLGLEPAWPVGSEGNLEQPHNHCSSAAAQQGFSGFGAMDDASSSGSQGSGRFKRSIDPPGRTADLNSRQRSSKRLASKRAQQDVQESPQSSPILRNPEADLTFREILGQNLSGQLPGPALPPRLPEGNTGQLALELGSKQPSLEENLSLPRLSSSMEPVPSGTQAPAVLTLDQALDSVSPTQSFSLGLHNPFAEAANDSTWQLPAKAEGSEGQGGRASPSSTVTCHQDQLTLSMPQQVSRLSLSLYNCLLSQITPEFRYRLHTTSSAPDSIPLEIGYHLRTASSAPRLLETAS